MCYLHSNTAAFAHRRLSRFVIMRIVLPTLDIQSSIQRVIELPERGSQVANP
jgi:hypothetical protein